MSIVVTGAQGQLGSELCRQWDPEAIGLDLPEFDLRDRNRVLQTIGEIRPRAVVNTAAYTLVDRAEEEPELCRAVNVSGVAYLAEVCRAVGSALVQISTDYVFGNSRRRKPYRRTPYRETDQPRPAGVYARSKFHGELRAAACEDHLIVRTCGLYGRTGARSAGNFPQAILRLAEGGKPLRVVDDQQCTPSYVPHVARAIRFLVETHATGIVHVVNSGDTTWYGMAAEILRQSDLRVPLEPISTAEYAARAPRPAYSLLDTAKYCGLPGHPRMPHWRDAVTEFLAARLSE
jgi:dTDP-4-dehydrorhamnose reductase